MSIRHRLKIFGMLFAGLMLAGCGAFAPPEAEFTTREETGDLTRSLAKGVEAQLEDSFGTPHELVAWLKLPVDYGGIPGSALESEIEGPLNKFPVQFDSLGTEEFTAQFEDEEGSVSFPKGGAILEWMTGERAGESMHVIGFDQESQLFSTQETMEVAPAAGETFILSAGDNLKHGRALYMEHCMHCHGVSGDGNGPTAPYLNPRPRDYRLGQFKFKSTKPAEKVRAEDLSRVIKYGIPGTYMPSFLLLQDDELHAIVEYVRWLSMRGELEYRVVKELEFDYSKQAIKDREESGESDEELEADIESTLDGLPELFDSLGGDLAENWKLAEDEESLVVPTMARVDDSFESRARGRKFFLEKCTNCHGHTGRGNGSMTEDFQKDDATGETYDEPGLFDIWGNPIKPRNLTKGLYRGGRRPIDVYRRLYGGIGPSKMPNFATTPPETLWDTVNYVMHIPFEEPGEYTEIDAEYEKSKKAGTEEKTAENAENSEDRKQTSIVSNSPNDEG